MKYILKTEKPCTECKALKMLKEFAIENEPKDHYQAAYKTYILNDCKECGKYSAKLI